VLHELNIQSPQECANLTDSLSKIISLDSNDIAASKDHNQYNS